MHTTSLKDTLTLTLIATPATQLLPHLLPSCKITFGERLGKYPRRPGFQMNGAAVIKQHQDDHCTRGTGNNDSSFLSSNFCSLLITETPHRGDFTERNQKSTILLVDCCLSFCFLLYKKRRSAHLVEAPTGSSSCCSLHSQFKLVHLHAQSNYFPAHHHHHHLCLLLHLISVFLRHGPYLFITFWSTYFTLFFILFFKSASSKL